MRFDNNQPWSERHFIAIESVEDVKALEQFEAQKHQRMLIG